MNRRSAITALEMFDYYVKIQPEAPAAATPENALNYGEFNAQAEYIAASLQCRGIAAGDRVALITTNRIEAMVLLYATMKIGAVYVPVNFRLAPKEIEYVLKDSSAKAVFVEEEPYRAVVDGLELPNLETRVLFNAEPGETWLGWDTLLKEDTADFSADIPSPDTQVYQMYTSGTTGFPKGVMITQEQLANLVVSGNMLKPTLPDDARHLVVAPLFHGAAMCSAITILSAGKSLYILDNFDPQGFVDTLVNERITDVTVVPAILHAILFMVPNIEQYDFSNLLRITYGASPITVDLLQKSLEVFDCEFQQVFGMTEVGAIATILTAADHRQALNGKPELLRSCGRASPFNCVKIVDPETRKELPVGEVGEIAVETPHMMTGYAGLAEKTAEVIEGSWYFSGDGGYLDEDGYLYIKDRIKDMIVSGGENVYPAEVENALAWHPAVADVAVIGAPDEKYGEAVVAVLVAAPDQERPTNETLIEYCREHLAGYKIPRRYEYVDVLPRNASGKLLKNELRAQFAE